METVLDRIRFPDISSLYLLAWLKPSQPNPNNCTNQVYLKWVLELENDPIFNCGDDWLCSRCWWLKLYGLFIYHSKKIAHCKCVWLFLLFLQLIVDECSWLAVKAAGWPLRQTTSADGMALAAMAPIVSWSPASQGHASAVLMEGKGPGHFWVSFHTIRKTWARMVKVKSEERTLSGYYVNTLSGAHVEQRGGSTNQWHFH